MEQPETQPPFFEENANFQKSDIVLSESISFEEIIESENNRLAFISSHSNPLYQGPFSKPIGMRILKKSFSDFTSFKHSNIAVCLNRNPRNIWGPASRKDGSLIYNCQIGNCEVKCLCVLCQNPTSCTNKGCLSSPCSVCEHQCKSHIILPMRNFSDDHLFTIVAGIGDNSYISVYSKYPGVLKTCQLCKDDLRNHETYHKVFHLRCKFCRHDFRFIDGCISSINLRNKKLTISKKDDNTCSICFKILSSVYHRKKHEEDAHKSQEHVCKVCYETFQTAKSLKRHVDDCHTTNEKIQTCDLCGKILSTEASLSRHKDTVHGKPSHICNHCGDNFTQKCNYERHILEVHGFQSRLNLDFVKPNLIYQYKCDECESQFPRKFSLERHKKTVHGTEKKLYYCPICKKGFDRKFTMKRHMEKCKHKST